MFEYDVNIRLSLSSARAQALVQGIRSTLAEAGLRVEDSVPGLIVGRRVPPEKLAELLQGLSDMIMSPAGAAAADVGVFDDLWVHLTRSREHVVR